MFFELRKDGPRSHTSKTFGKLLRDKTYRTTDADKIKKIKLDRRFNEVPNPATGEFDDEVTKEPAKSGGVAINKPATKSANVEKVEDADDRPKLPAERFATKNDAINFAKKNGLMKIITENEDKWKLGKFNKQRATKTLDDIVRKAYATKYPPKDDVVNVAGSDEEVVELNT